MTIHEITALRKSGHLKEALEAAECEFAHRQNLYTAGALFWCLADLPRQQNAFDAIETLERMKSLYSDFCEGDEYMPRAIESVSRRAQPLYRELNEAFMRAKNGETILDEYQHFSGIFKEGSLDPALYDLFGWLTYYALRQTDINLAHEHKLMLATYLKLNLPRPSVLHSLILSEAVRVEQSTPLQFRIRDFIRLWGLDNLRDDDWEQFTTDQGNTLPSLVEKLIGVYAKELKTDGVEAPGEFCQLVDKALLRYPNSQNMPYFKATVLISQGKTDEALSYYKDLILRFPSKYYLWNQSAALVDDADTRIGLLCKALTCGADENFLGNVRLSLASLLIAKGLTPDAKFELEKYRRTYQKNGWNLKGDFWQLYSPLSAIQAAESNAALYAGYAVRADEFVYSSLPSELAVKVAETQNDDRNHPGRKFTVWILRTARSTMRLRKPAKFGLDRRTPDGAVFDVKTKDGKIVWIKPHSGSFTATWLKEQTGTVSLRTDRKGKKYAIIGGTYVGEKLLSGITDGRQIRILALLQPDGRWSALALL